MLLPHYCVNKRADFGLRFKCREFVCVRESARVCARAWMSVGVIVGGIYIHISKMSLSVKKDIRRILVTLKQGTTVLLVL